MRSSRFFLAAALIALLGACASGLLPDLSAPDQSSDKTTTSHTMTSETPPPTTVVGTEPPTTRDDDFFTTLVTVPVHVALDDPAVIPVIEEATDLLAGALDLDAELIVPYQVLDVVWFDDTYGCPLAFGEPTEEGFFEGYQVELIVNEDVWYVHAPDDADMAVCADMPVAAPVLPDFDSRLLDPVTIGALANSPLPVLLPVPPEPFEARNPFVSETSYAVVLRRLRVPRDSLQLNGPIREIAARRARVFASPAGRRGE